MDDNNIFGTEETCIKLNTIDSMIETNDLTDGRPLKTQSSIICRTEEKYNKGKMMMDTVLEKKSYEEKVRILQNRIKKLQDQEKEINKKTGKMKEKYLVEQKLKSERWERKDYVEVNKIKNEKLIEEKKQEIENLRLKRKEEREKAIKEQMTKNKVISLFIKKVYQNSKNEKIFWKSIESDIKSHNSNLKNYKCLKVKQDYVEKRTERFKSQVEKEEEIKSNYETKLKKEIEEKEKLKDALKELEAKEFDYINRLKNTVILKQQELEDFKTNKMNNSVVILTNPNQVRHQSATKRPTTSSVPKQTLSMSTGKKEKRNY